MPVYRTSQNGLYFRRGKLTEGECGPATMFQPVSAGAALLYNGHGMGATETAAADVAAALASSGL
jgi:hypothetical protein